MNVSLLDLFKIGIGPSSSHTVGPMIAAYRFCAELEQQQLLEQVNNMCAETFGSLALTGIGHATDKALLLGLSGQQPHLLDPDAADRLVDDIRRDGVLRLMDSKPINFNVDTDLKFNRRKLLPFHSNGMRFSALDEAGNLLLQGIYYSIGGGFVVSESESQQDGASEPTEQESLPFPFASARELLSLCREKQKSIAEIVLANELTRLDKDSLLGKIDELWQTMEACIDRGCNNTGLLPGRLKVNRRASELFQRLESRDSDALADPMAAMDWINLWAIAVNEENAAGGKVVTAPTNGAAGIIPAVLRYYDRFCRDASKQGIHDFFLVATAIGALYKKNASISGAEVGCQGEVGVACSMAAAGLTAALGGSNEQVENAAEIAMEHNLGLTCDPIGGLVQIPCIERNAIGAVKAIDASRMAMLGDGVHKVSLDKVIATMRQTGMDMRTKYKETSKGGLAVNVVEC